MLLIGNLSIPCQQKVNGLSCGFFPFLTSLSRDPAEVLLSVSGVAETRSMAGFNGQCYKEVTADGLPVGGSCNGSQETAPLILHLRNLGRPTSCSGSCSRLSQKCLARNPLSSPWPDIHLSRSRPTSISYLSSFYARIVGGDRFPDNQRLAVIIDENCST